MKLLEYRGKLLLHKVGIKIPPAILVDNKSYINLSYHKERYRQFFAEHKKVIIKAQVIATGRKKQGLIVAADNFETSLQEIDKLYQTKFSGHPIDTLLIEKSLAVAEEYFLSIIYDTKTRQPMILFGRQGGIEIESSGQELVTCHPQKLEYLYDFEARQIAKDAGFKGGEMIQLAALISKAYDCFIKYHCISCEINPIIKTADGLLFAGDAKVTIDDSAIARLDEFADITDTEDKSFLSELEIEARRIDQNDYRGVAGKTFVELDGDIAVLASGGGASLTCMDALIKAGGQPANYTEYSGNPPREKVRKLTEVTLSKKALNGCLVIGGTANFTDIFDTLSGFAEGLLNVSPKPNYPIIIRRAGPRDKEAFEMLKQFAAEHNFDITLYDESTPMTLAAKLAAEKIAEYKKSQ